MKRRQFLQGSMKGIAATAAGIAVGGKALAEPIQPQKQPAATPVMGSLSISRSGLPPQFWAAHAEIAEVIADTSANREKAERLLTNPAAYLREIGVNIGSHEIYDESASVLAVTLDKEFQFAVAEGDYAKVMLYLQSAKVTSGFNGEGLRKAVERILNAQSQSLGAEVKARFPVPMEHNALMQRMAAEGLGSASADDLAIIRDVFESNLSTKGQDALLAVSIAAIFVTAAAYVVVWVVVGAWVLTSGPDEEQNEQQRVRGGRGERIASLDPVLMGDYERTLKVAALTGDREITRLAMVNLIRAESEAVIGALRSCGYLRGPASNDEDLVAATTRYAVRVAGVDK